MLDVVNLSLASGEASAEMKTAKVIPEYKHDDHSLLSIYRPVSLFGRPIFDKETVRVMR